MTAEKYSAYQKRFLRVIDFIDSHLDEELDLASLSAVAAYSKFHFLRQFSALFGVGVHEYVQTLRLRRAAHQLAFRTALSVTEISAACGYDNAESFARAFKKVYGQTPSAFRDQPQWTIWQHQQQALHNIRTQMMRSTTYTEPIEIVQFAETQVAVYEHRGAPALIGQSVRAFIAWRKQNQLPPKVSATFNLLYDDPETTAPEQYRLDIGAAIKTAVAANASGIVTKIIPAGRCARLRHIGPDAAMAAKIHFLYCDWLPASGEELRDFPLFLQRISFFPDVAEQDMVTDIYLPLQ